MKSYGYSGAISQWLGMLPYICPAGAACLKCPCSNLTQKTRVGFFLGKKGGEKKSIVIMLNLGKNCILNQAFSSMWAIWFWALSFPSQSSVMRRYCQGLSNLKTLKFCWVRAEAVVCTAPLDSPWSTSGSAYHGHLTQLLKPVFHRVALLRRKRRKYTLAHGRTGGSVREKLRVGLSVMPWGYWWSQLQSSAHLAWKHEHNWENRNWDEKQPYILEQFLEVFVFPWFGTDPTCITESSTRATSSKQWTLRLNPRSTETQWCPQMVPMPNIVRETLHQLATANSELFV